MGLKSAIIKLVAKMAVKRLKQENAVQSQIKIFNRLIKQAKNTQFGKDHQFNKINCYNDFKTHIPVRDYEQAKPYFDKVKNGEADILWPNKPLYFAKTSGTTSGAKYIPITKASIGHHITAARNALFFYVAETNNANFFNGKMIFLQGSPELTETNGVKTGRLSGIVYHHVPSWLLSNRKPSYNTNCINDWETKVNAIVNETETENMSLISGIPPWCIHYFEKLLEKTGKTSIKQLFPNFNLFVYGGVNYAPYKQKIETLIGKSIPTIETYPASEGFFAYQDSQAENGLLLNTNAGIFYEFVPADEIFSPNPTRLMLNQVELNKNYALIVSTNAGLWAYNIGDTVKFTSIKPYRIVVTGRTKHFISAFGEHVIQQEVEWALTQAKTDLNIDIKEFTVAPYVAKNQGESYHEWFVEFGNKNELKQALAEKIDTYLQSKNEYYKDLRQGQMLTCVKITEIQANGFLNLQKAQGKLGGQNKVKRLANNRELANLLAPYVKNG